MSTEQQLEVLAGEVAKRTVVGRDDRVGHGPFARLQLEDPFFDRVIGNWLVASVDEAADPGFFVRFLDASRTRALHRARTIPQAAFAHLALSPGLSVLDCGCGTGDILAIIAEQMAPGRAVGGDVSTTMIEEARRRAVAGPSNLEFERIDVQSLPFADATFDRVLASQLLVHVSDPRGAVREMCRVMAQPGRIAIADMDWDTLVLGCSDKPLGRRFTQLFSDGIRNGLVVREYGGWLRAEGFSNIQVLPQPFVFDQWDFVRTWIIEPSLPHFVASGGMSAAQASALLQDLAQRHDTGRFFAASTLYTIVGDRT